MTYYNLFSVPAANANCSKTTNPPLLDPPVISVLCDDDARSSKINVNNTKQESILYSVEKPSNRSAHRWAIS